jgi:hypothetical protein
MGVARTGWLTASCPWSEIGATGRTKHLRAEEGGNIAEREFRDICPW